ncbi:MAG: enhanced intracellular survival protein Eis [Aminipila sp.]
MREIRKLTKDDLDQYREITYNAYPSLRDFSEEGIRAYNQSVLDIIENDSKVAFYGLFEESKMIAVMRLFELEMNCFGKVLPVSGLGFLGVHAAYKQMGAAKAMLTFYEELYKGKGLPIGTLIPFRPDFYKKMGYGIGTKMSRYRIATERIPAYDGKSDIRFIDSHELDFLLECHARVASKTHGMLMKHRKEISEMHEAETARYLGCYDENKVLRGYLTYEYRYPVDGNYTRNEIFIREFIYEDIEVMRQLLGFLRKQADQVQIVVFNTEDDNFYYLFDNPTNDGYTYIEPCGYLETNMQGIGAMYKLFDIAESFVQCAHRNYNNANICIGFIVKNELYGTESKTVVTFCKGMAEVVPEETVADVTLTMNGADFAPMFLGAVSPQGLYNLGLLKLDKPERLYDVDRTFYCSCKPVWYSDL